MKIALDVDIRTNGEGKLEVVASNVAKVGDAAEKANSRGLSVFRGGLQGIAAGLAGAGVIAGLGALARGAIQTGDELLTMHERTGLAVETLSVLKFHGDAAGTSLDAIARGMQFASRSAVEAANGNEQAAAGFRKLGIPISELKRLSPEQLLERVAKGLQGVENPSLRSAIAMQTLGKGSAELTPVLAQLAEDGFGGLQAAAEDMGAVMSQDAAEAADTLGDVLDALKKNIQAGIMQSIASLMGAFSHDLPEGSARAVVAFNPLTMAIKGVTALVIILINVIKGIGATIGGLADMAITVGPQIIELFKKLGETAWEALKAAFTPGADADDLLAKWAETQDLGGAIVRNVRMASASIDEEVGKIVERTQDQLFKLFEKPAAGESIINTGDLDLGLTDKDAERRRKEAEREAARALAERLRLLEAIERQNEKIAEQERERAEASADLILKSRETVEIITAQLEAIRAVAGEEKVRAEYAVRNLEAQRKYREALRQIEDELGSMKITPEAAAEAQWAAYQQLLVDEAAAHAQFQTELTDDARQGAADRLAAEEAAIDRWKQKVDEFGGHLKQVFRDAIQIAFSGGDVTDIIDSFFDMFLQKSQESLMAWAEAWIDTFSSWAMGETPQAGPYAGQAPTSGQQKGALGGMAAIQGAAALYGVYQQPGTRAQNMSALAGAGGAIGGAIAGAQAGGVTGPWGAVIGMLVGALIGAFMPTEDGKNIKIYSMPGQGVRISGLDDWGAEKAIRNINAAIDSTAMAMDNILLGLPSSILDQLTRVRPDQSTLDAFAGKADGKNWTEELENFIRFKVPQHVMKAYEPILFQAMTLLGVEEDRIAEIFARASKLDPTKAQEFINSYVQVIVGLSDSLDFLSMNLEGRRAEASRVVNMTAIDRMGEIDDRLTTLGRGFFDLPLEQQISRGQQMIALLDERYQLEIQYLAQIKQLQDEIARSVENQIFEIAQTQRTPEQQIDALLERQRDLFTQLKEASTPEEVARIMGEIQQNAGRLFDMMGRTPEAAAQITTMLTDAGELADQQLERLASAVEQMDTLMRNTLEAILEFLQGIEQPNPRRRAAGKGTGGTTPGGSGPITPGEKDQYAEAAIAAGAFGSVLVGVTTQLATFGTALDSWATNFDASVASPTQFVVQVNVAGSLAGVVQGVTAAIIPVIDTRASSVAARTQSRFGSPLL